MPCDFNNRDLFDRSFLSNECLEQEIADFRNVPRRELAKIIRVVEYRTKLAVDLDYRRTMFLEMERAWAEGKFEMNTRYRDALYETDVFYSDFDRYTGEFLLAEVALLEDGAVEELQQLVGEVETKDCDLGLSVGEMVVIDPENRRVRTVSDTVRQEKRRELSKKECQQIPIETLIETKHGLILSDLALKGEEEVTHGLKVLSCAEKMFVKLLYPSLKIEGCAVPCKEKSVMCHNTLDGALEKYSVERVYKMDWCLTRLGDHLSLCCPDWSQEFDLPICSEKHLAMTQRIPPDPHSSTSCICQSVMFRIPFVLCDPEIKLAINSISRVPPAGFAHLYSAVYGSFLERKTKREEDCDFDLNHKRSRVI